MKIFEGYGLTETSPTLTVNRADEWKPGTVGNVAPAPLEDRLRAHPLISQAVVVGDARPFIAALITLDHEAVAEWATERGMADASITELAETVELRAVIQSAVDKANRSVSRAESIRSFALLPDELTIAGGELTPTLKVRRVIVEKQYGHVIDTMYGQPATNPAGTTPATVSREESHA